MIFNPNKKVIASHLTVSEFEHQPLVPFERPDKLETVKQQEHFHRRMGDALIAVDERVIQCQREAEGRSLPGDGRMQIGAAERGARLGQSRFQRTKVADAGRSAGLNKDRFVQFEDFTERQISHQARRLYSSWFFCSTRVTAA